ncbi:hypothetical protein VTK26DRAFT_5662 [Humicola hyalothermophila]
MPSIGPQLPPHLQKRKRTPDDEEPGSPPPKSLRRDNEDEIPLEDDSGDDFGPSAPNPRANNSDANGPSQSGPAIGPSLPASIQDDKVNAPAEQKRPIGPSMPPSAAPTNGDEIPLDSDSDNDVTGPAPPPTTAGPAAPPKRVIGPAPPPADLAERPPTGPDSDSDDSDDDWGPALPTEAGTAKSASLPASGAALAAAEASQPSAPKRDDWMLAPPTSSGYRAPDPTKLRNRKFASGPRAATEAKPGSGVSSIWTETPEQKARRLANAVLGREDPTAAAAAGAAAGSQPPRASSAKVAATTAADEARIRSYTEQTRGRSLVEEHQAARLAKKSGGKDGDVKRGPGGKYEEEEDDPSKRAFDWEKDMKVSGRISGAQRRELLNRAANLGGRFQSGKYL